MLQSVPDPFDSYGPPQAEDQIFSILAPLSIMTSSHSSSPSPLTGPSELGSFDSGDKIASWLPKTTNGGMFTSESTAWAISPSSSTPSTPPRSVSPPSHLPRRHSMPPSGGQRKAESKLRSVLSVIDETRPRHDVDDPPVQSGPIMTSLNGKKTPPPDTDTGQRTEWAFTYGQSPYDSLEEDPTTPRHSTLFFPQPPPPDPITEPPNEHNEPVQATLTPAVT